METAYYASRPMKRNVLLHYGPSTGDFSPLDRLQWSPLLFHKVPAPRNLSAHSSYLIRILRTVDRRSQTDGLFVATLTISHNLDGKNRLT